MKLNKHSLALISGLGTLTSCNDRLELLSPNQQTSSIFGFNANDLEERVTAAYNHIRMESSYARVDHTIDVCHGDEAWNSSQAWYLPFDDLNAEVTSNITWRSWREQYHTIDVCNFTISRCGEDNSQLTEKMKRIKGQALSLRALPYYNLVGYYQNPPLIMDHAIYSSLNGLYGANSIYDAVLDQVEKDFQEAMGLFPSRDEGSERGGGRATCGAAAGYYARVLMMRQKYSEALPVLKDIIGEKYGTYKLMDNYGDNFRRGSAYRNNVESLFEVQFLDYGAQGTDDERTPVNTSPNTTQGSAVESNFAPSIYGGWADISASPWLYQLPKEERTTGGKLDPRLYQTIGTYETDWKNFECDNVAYTNTLKSTDNIVTNNTFGGLPVAKFTSFRTGLCSIVAMGLHNGINPRLMRYSDVLLRATECENEVNGPTQQAIDWINEVRNRANLADLELEDFNSTDKLFEQIANVERPKEFGCEFGRGFDLVHWGFSYDSGRLQQLKEHGTVRCSINRVKDPVKYSDIASDSELRSTFDTYRPGHEFLPIVQQLMNNNPNLTGNSTNHSTDNSTYPRENGWKVCPVVELSK